MSRKGKIVLSIIVLLLGLKWWSLPPSEDQLKARFVEHRAEFEVLRSMVQADAPHISLHTLQNSIQRDDNSALPPARVQRYQALMQTLHIWRIDGNKERFRMYVFGGGFTDTSWSIGYAFSRKRPQKIVSSAYKRQFVRDTTVYSPLDGNWYLYQLR